ncbi:hypothetical protein D3C86_1743860 [compost metagenome]
MCQLQYFRHLSDALIDHLFFRTGQLQAKGHVFSNIKMGIERIGLEDHTDTAFGGRDIVHAGFTNKQIATGDSFKSSNHTQQC